MERGTEMKRGVDLSYAQGAVDFAALKRDGVSFVMLKASQGKLLADASAGPFTDPRFQENIRGAAGAGMEIGVYHYLCASGKCEACREAEYFLSVIAPYREKITLWAACDAEEERYLPAGRAALTECVKVFLDTVRRGGFRPMLYSNPNYLVYRLGDVSEYDLWLAYWGVPREKAEAYHPKIWQYGVTGIGGIRQVDGDYML